MEKEVNLIHQMNRELGGIHEKIVSLDEKISENHELHVENQGDIKLILDQTTKTNGRVTNLEKTTEVLARVESQNSGMIKAVQDRLGGTERDINELNKYRTSVEGTKIENRKQFLGIGYNLIEKITWGAIILIATNIVAIAEFISQLIKHQ